MLPSSLNSSVMAGVMDNSLAAASSTSQADAAGRMLDKHMNSDSSFPTLPEKLQIQPKGPCTVSGLSESDYPGGSATGGAGSVLKNLHTMHKVPLPKELLHHFQHMQCNCMMGLFPEIGRAWLTIDSDIYVWVYKDGSDLAYFDGLNDTILSVGLTKPKAGVFKPYIKHLLVLTTPSEMVLLGVTFGQPLDNSSDDTLTLLPEPLFTVSNDGGVFLMTVKGTEDGRLFMGAKDGSLWELYYQAEDGWFSRKCQKVNHSKSAFSSFLPSFLTLTEEDSIIQIEVDESRHILYTLTEKGTITVFDLGADGTSTVRVAVSKLQSIVNTAANVASTVDKSNFKNIVSICPIDTSEAPTVHLVAVTDSGVRLYFTTTSIPLLPTSRPHHLQLLHVRLPPGFSANALTHRPSKVHKALYSHGCGILCASESAESDVLWSVSSDQFPYHTSLAESQSVIAVDGVIWAIADNTPPSLWGKRSQGLTPTGMRPPMVVTQQNMAPRELVVLSAAGAHILTSLRPVDQLQYLLQECGGAEAASVKEFFSALSPLQGCATALILATDPNLQNSQVAECATQCLFRYGATVPQQTMLQPQMGMGQVQSPGQMSFHPMQISTPMQPQMYGNNQPHQSNPFNHSTTMQQVNGQSEQYFSALHDSLYLYLGRILRPVWFGKVMKEENGEAGAKTYSSTLLSSECGYLARQIELLAKFMNNSPSNGVSFSINSEQHNRKCSEEAVSLASLSSLLHHTLQVLRLWMLLTNHQFTSVITALPTQLMEQLKTMTLRDLVLGGRDLCRTLIMTLLDKYHGDNASVTAISNQLREVCPHLYRAEDAQLSRASQIILEAKAISDPVAREKAFSEAIALCKGVGGCVNVAGVASQLASGSCYTGVVDLVLSVAGQRDKEGRGLHYYKGGQPNSDNQGYSAFNSRMECYKVLIDHLNQLAGSTSVNTTLGASSLNMSVPNRPGPPIGNSSNSAMQSSDANHFINLIINLVASGEDVLAQVTIFQWLLDTERTEQLLSLKCAYLETYLKTPPTTQTMRDLLWRYYERNKDYYNAAMTLTKLADQSGNMSLTTRVEHLSRALMCLSSCEMCTTAAYTEFLLHLEEKKDVARVQLMVLEGVTSVGASEEVIQSLNSKLLDITELYEKFAEPFNLWECKLAIVACAGHSEPQLIQSLWTNIIETELQSSAGSPTSVRMDALATKLKGFARQYTNNPQYFPLEHIIRVCEVLSVQLNVENTGWLVTGLLSCGLSINKLMNTYHALYRAGDSVWEAERAPYHLLRVLCHLITLLVDSPPLSLHSTDRRLLREQCLDRVASYLTDLETSAEPSAGLIASHLRTCQLHLERSNS